MNIYIFKIHNRASPPLPAASFHKSWDLTIFQGHHFLPNDQTNN